MSDIPMRICGNRHTASVCPACIAIREAATALDEVVRLRTEVERLRGALRLLLDRLDEAGCTADGHPGPDCWICNEEAAARSALEAKP